MGTPLTGSSVASTYTGLLKNSDNSTVGATLKAISDGSGNDSALQVSNAAVNTTGDFSVATNKLTVASASGNTAVAGTLAVTGATNLSSLITSGAATIGGALNVTGATTLTGNLTVPGNLAVTGTSTLTGATAVTGTLGVAGASTLASVGVTGAATVGTTLGVTGATSLASVTVGTTLGVTGAATLASVGVTGAATVGTTLGVTGATTLASLGVTGAATVGTTLGVTGNTTLTGDLAANGNTTLGNAGTDTLTLNSDNITTPNVSTVAIDSANDKIFIQDATDNNVRLVVSSSVTTTKAVYSEKISNTQFFTFSGITNVYPYNANGGSQFQYTHTFKTIGNTAIISMSVPVKVATSSQVYLIIADGSSVPSIANVIACGIASVGSANGETTISFSTKFVSTSLSHTFYIWAAGSGTTATYNTYTPSGGLPGYFYPNSIFSLIETA
jgi:hypothetical protein